MIRDYSYCQWHTIFRNTAPAAWSSCWITLTTPFAQSILLWIAQFFRAWCGRKAKFIKGAFGRLVYVRQKDVNEGEKLKEQRNENVGATHTSPVGHFLLQLLMASFQSAPQ